MKNLLIVVLFFVSTSVIADEWTAADSYRESAFQVLNIIDWGQTRYVAQHPELYQEKQLSNGGSSQFIGSQPTINGVDSFMLKVSALHLVASYLLPSDWRDAFQYITIGAKLDATINNVNIGVKFKFN